MSNIYTCTLNLAIDLFIETEQLHPSIVNRTIDDDIQANGKGVNVSLILKMLNIDSVAIGYKAGFTGQYIEDFLAMKGIASSFIDVPGLTRINVFTQVNETGEEFKLVNRGPEIFAAHKRALLTQIDELKKGDFLCISGSNPRGISPLIFPEIAKTCAEKGISLILDTSYKEVLDCLQYQPFLLKPNEEELSSWFGVKIETHLDYLFYGKKLIELGAKNVLLSLGGEGAYWFNQDTILYGNSPKGKVVNTACAGDTLLGTFLAGIIHQLDGIENLKRSIAAGSSTAFRKGITDFSDVEKLEVEIKVKQVH
ncbi:MULTISPECIES: 1-phosphofructokinase [unclassified Enterococcus]|uniref:1-phosphofructokinase n=1 Tax=unclassified Enterococcus TaxID=2608891 RepID=UPI001551F69D|nr:MULTISPECIES: 1-phosphofructokinase [unclassified Enterococcus]MBS7576072.1 1-phosphofructokinase [Enterococcus sp. MMGLQ5-2]MBS7583305.1 1-phosphofructokinase [Enterococcus sp. MMGLQ5-1]NPD11165.1 1-phosphofructokinase [Enterococcus sp. MMGLQ5-1]NPD35908.1 1-phosphofructokinase [Enterococcus sp. MMGLQ5-2]